MKYMKLSSFLILGLLLAMPAMADVECGLRNNFDDIRAESKDESIENLVMRCSWDEGNEIGTTAGDSMFDLVLRFSAPLTNDSDNPIYIQLPGDDPAAAEDATAVTSYLIKGTLRRDRVHWEDVPFPIDVAEDATTDALEAWNTSQENQTGEFWITMITVDATRSGEEVTVLTDMEVTGIAQGSFDVDDDRVVVANVTKAMELEFDSDDEAEINACLHEAFKVDIMLEEGFDEAWLGTDDIRLMVSAGTITTEDETKGPLELLREGSSALLYDVQDPDDEDSETVSLTVEIDPPAGEVGDDIMLSAMFVPVRGDSEFVESGRVTVGSYVTCKGDTLVFPFITNQSGYDTGVALMNDSETDGSCILGWGGEVPDADDVQSRDRVEVSSGKHEAFLVSLTNPDFMGLLRISCTFPNAYGYAFITDYSERSGAQGYLAIEE